MTGQKPFLAGKLLKLAGEVMLLVAVGAIAGTAPGNTAAASDTLDEPSQSAWAAAWPELATYVVGYGLAMALTIAAFALVHWHWTLPSTALWIVFALALVQIIVHFRCFLHVTLHGPARDDLQLILFSTLIVLMMVGGTLVLLLNLRMRMM